MLVVMGSIFPTAVLVVVDEMGADVDVVDRPFDGLLQAAKNAIGSPRANRMERRRPAVRITPT